MNTLTRITTVAIPVITGIGFPIALIAIAGRTPTPQYRIPPEKRDAAAQFAAKLTESMMKDKMVGQSPTEVADHAWRIAEKAYGEPVVEEKK